MKAIILAGGFGTRLRERVPDLPKPMAPVVGRPFLEYLLDRLIAGGVTEIILSVGYQADAIQSHFGNTYQTASLEYAIEHEPLGTGGAIALAINQYGSHNEPVLVLNGDTFLDIDYGELIQWHGKQPGQVSMVLREVPDVARYGSVLVEKEYVTGFLEKGQSGPGLINAGVYIIQPGVFEAFGLTGKFGIEAEFLQRHCGELSPRAFLTDAYFIDIGVPDDYDRAQIELPALFRQSQ